jgi:hypothetical protein
MMSTRWFVFLLVVGGCNSPGEPNGVFSLEDPAIGMTAT